MLNKEYMDNLIFKPVTEIQEVFKPRAKYGFYILESDDGLVVLETEEDVISVRNHFDIYDGASYYINSLEALKSCLLAIIMDIY